MSVRTFLIQALVVQRGTDNSGRPRCAMTIARAATLEGPVRSKQTGVWIVLWTGGGQPVDGCPQGSGRWGQPGDNRWSDRNNRSSGAVHKLWKKLCATASACREKRLLRRVAPLLNVRVIHRSPNRWRYGKRAKAPPTRSIPGRRRFSKPNRRRTPPTSADARAFGLHAGPSRALVVHESSPRALKTQRTNFAAHSSPRGLRGRPRNRHRRMSDGEAASAASSRRYSPEVTLTGSAMVTSGCRRTVTECLPVVLM